MSTPYNFYASAVTPAKKERKDEEASLKNGEVIFSSDDRQYALLSSVTFPWFFGTAMAQLRLQLNPSQKDLENSYKYLDDGARQDYSTVSSQGIVSLTIVTLDKTTAKPSNSLRFTLSGLAAIRKWLIHDAEPVVLARRMKTLRMKLSNSAPAKKKRDVSPVMEASEEEEVVIPESDFEDVDDEDDVEDEEHVRLVAETLARQLKAKKAQITTDSKRKNTSE